MSETAGAPTSPAREDGTTGARRWFGRRPASVAIDVVIATLLAAAAFVVHPLSYALHHPLWLDEAWVATLARAPWSRAYASSSSTPLGWLFLVRLVPGGRGEQLRLVPILFSAAAVAAAFVVGRSLPWRTTTYQRVAGVVIALTVLLAPASLARNDLKQYTADAFFAIVLVGLASRAEGTPGPRTLGELVVGSIVAMAFSTVAAFVALALFSGLFFSALAARSKERVVTVLIGAGLVAVTTGIYFALVVVPRTNSRLRAYWNRLYLPSSPIRVAQGSWHRLATIAPALGVPVVIAVGLFAAGCVTCARIGRPGLAVVLVLLWIEMIVLAMLRRYPFLDLRTSQFLLTVSLVLIAVGLLGIIEFVVARRRWLAIAIAVVSATLYVHSAAPYIRARTMPNEDVRSATAYVARHRRSGDIIVVTLPSSYGFSYYWPGGRIAYASDAAVSTGFVTRVSGLGDVVYVNGLSSKDTTGAMRRALDASRTANGSRIWIIRSHLFPSEGAAWKQTFQELGRYPLSMQVGAEPLWMYARTAPIGS